MGEHHDEQLATEPDDPKLDDIAKLMVGTVLFVVFSMIGVRVWLNDVVDTTRATPITTEQ